MSAADYRLMTDATGQRIATALENLDVANDWEQMNNVTWNKTFVYNVALYQNHTVYVQMTIGSNGAASGDILAVLPTNAKCRVFVPIAEWPTSKEAQKT